MAEGNRVKRWRQAKSDQGLKAVTVWLTTDEELYLKDLAAKWQCSPSKVLQQALAKFQPTSQQSIGNVPDTKLIREMIRAELTAMQATLAPVTEHVRVTGTEDTCKGEYHRDS
jgi:hypothetical protein